MRSEWDHYNHHVPFDSADMFPRGIRNSVHHCVVEASVVGVWFDQGTIDSGVHDCMFRNYSWAGVAFNRNLGSLAAWPDWHSSSGSWELDNLYLEAGVCAHVRDQHPNLTSDPTCERERVRPPRPLTARSCRPSPGS